MQKLHHNGLTNFTISLCRNAAHQFKSKATNKQSGFTLIELTIFIIVLGIIAIGLLLGLNVAAERQPDVQKSAIALTIAEQRLDIILGNKAINGFDSYSDPCSGGSPPAVCTTPSGYSTNVSTATNWNGDTNYNVITVTVSGDGSAILRGLVADY